MTVAAAALISSKAIMTAAISIPGWQTVRVYDKEISLEWYDLP
jgi:hypothetical protein